MGGEGRNQLLKLLTKGEKRKKENLGSNKGVTHSGVHKRGGGGKGGKRLKGEVFLQRRPFDDGLAKAQKKKKSRKQRGSGSLGGKSSRKRGHREKTRGR